MLAGKVVQKVMRNEIQVKAVRKIHTSRTSYFSPLTTYHLPLTSHLSLLTGIKQFFLFLLRKAFVPAVGDFVEDGVNFILRDGGFCFRP